ncbi:MAG: ribosome biogenesis GTPase Der [Chloroflexi bacterium RBG_16_50_11]|nr:MAG: ribosome biogenesis GTPase Der [Chloroflexi bacterium RBG_16_50_11]
MTKPVVAIVGRPNTGKSTLLNRIVKRPVAITEDLPGTTRDRNMADVAWQGVEFTLVDTGGLETAPSNTIARGVKTQVETAIREASVIVDVVDAIAGVTAADMEIADILRRSNKPVLVAANKADNARLETEALEFYELGLGEPLAISAHHSRGVAELLDKIIELLPAQEPEKAAPESIKVAIVGRPNVGKSMLLNTLVGEERSIVDVTPGTTRDAVDTPFDFNGQNMLLIDTAGIRRRGKIKSGVEQYSVVRTFRAIDRADVVLLVLDATELVTTQDTHIAGYIQEAAKGIIIIINKWDLVENRDNASWNKALKNEFKFASYAPILYTSAKSGEGVDKIMPQVVEVYRERLKRLPTAAVNNVIQQAVAAHNRPTSHGKQLKIYYATQAEANPPTFVFFTNDAKLVHFSYRRFLENQLRQAFGFNGTPLRLNFKTRGKP